MQPEKVIYTNSLGRSITLTSSRPFILESVEGKGDVGANIQMQSAPYQDGATYIDSILSMRNVTLNLNIVTDTRDELNAARQELSSCFNPKLGLGKLEYFNGDVHREIYVAVEGVPSYPTGNKGRRWQQAVINLVAPNPYWLNINPDIVKLEDYTGNFRFPFRGPGIRFATRGDRRTVVNDGDSPTPIKVRFVGNAVNPLLKNETTGEYIKVNYTIPEGFEMHINTADGNKTVELVDSVGTRTNVFNYIDLASTFFKLDQGENVLSFITEGGQPDVYIEFYNHYLGV